jgi:hypothetical protein
MPVGSERSWKRTRSPSPFFSSSLTWTIARSDVPESLPYIVVLTASLNTFRAQTLTASADELVNVVDDMVFGPPSPGLQVDYDSR